MVDRDDQECMGLFVDAEDDPVLASSGRVVLGEVQVEFAAHSSRVVSQSSVDELNSGCRDLLRQASEIALG